MPIAPLQPNTFVNAQQPSLEHKTFAVELIDDTADDVIYLRMIQPNTIKKLSSGSSLKALRKNDTEIRLFKCQLNGNIIQFYGVKNDFSKAYIATRVDYENDDLIQVVAVDNSGAAQANPNNGGSKIKAEVAGVVSFEGTPAERPVIIIADDQQNGRRVVAEQNSNADGSFLIEYNDWEGSVIALALDHYGDDWIANKTINSGTIVHPTTPNGFVYESTVGGVTGITEPAWSTDGAVAIQDGAVTWQAKPYYRPVASGAIKGNLTADSIRFWTPKETAPVLWLDASDTSTITIEAGVSAWVDKSANRMDVFQDAASKQPIVVENALNNRNGIQFKGGQTLHSLTNYLPTGANERYFFVVADFGDYPGILNDEVLFIYGNRDEGEAFLLAAGSENKLLFNTWGGDPYDQILELPEYENQPTIYGHFYDGTSLQAKANGVSLNTSAVQLSTGNGQLYLGQRGDDERFLSGFVYEILVTDSLEFEAEIFGYLAHKWGLTDKLDDNHPFKNTAPTIAPPSDS